MINAASLISKFKYALDNGWGYIWGAAGLMWTENRQQQKVNYMVSKYGADWKKNADAKKDNYYSAALYGSKWIGHYVADCSGLFVWAFKQLGGAIYHGSNSIYDRYCTSEKGKLTDELKKKLLPGTAVFVDKSGNKSHIGLYIGNGKVIEASGTQAGVCISNITAGKWSYYGLLKNVDYSAQNAPEDPSGGIGDKLPAVNYPTLKRGCKGQYVKELQILLNKKGYSLGSYGIDGDFGSATQAAVVAFQKDHGLTPDGIAGTITWEALLNDSSPQKFYTVTIPHLTESEADAVIAKYPSATKEIEKG